MGSLSLKCIRSKYLELNHPLDLEILKHYHASYIISLTFLERIRDENQLREICEIFENNIDTIKKLFEEIKEYSKEKFLEGIRKL